MPRREPCGVRVRDGREGVAVGHVVHCECDGWRLTSALGLEEVLTGSVLDRLLPGPLGSYVYPDDVVFHVDGNARTTRADLDRVIARYTRRHHQPKHGRHHHLSVDDADASDDDASSVAGSSDTSAQDESGEEEDEDDVPLEDDEDSGEEEDDDDDDAPPLDDV